MWRNVKVQVVVLAALFGGILALVSNNTPYDWMIYLLGCTAGCCVMLLFMYHEMRKLIKQRNDYRDGMNFWAMQQYAKRDVVITEEMYKDALKTMRDPGKDDNG